MHIAKASIQPSRPRQLKPCVGSPSSSFCRRVIDDESFVGIKRSMSRTFVFFPFLSFSLSNFSIRGVSRCLHRGSQSYGFKFGQVFEPKLLFLGRVAQCVGTSIGVLHC